MNNNLMSAIYQKFIQDGYNIASRECVGGYPDKEECAWYHGNWMLFRYLGVVSNPYWHESFYQDALHFVRANEKEDFLVAGTADFSMPLLCSEFGIPKISICDMCSTPLKICDIVSEFIDYDWTTFIQDVCAEFSSKYDIVINDAFLSRFIDKDKPLKGICGSLKRGGYYITTLKKGNPNKGGEVSDSIRKNFMQKVKKRYIEKMAYLPDIDIDTISAMYVDKMSSYPIKDEEELYELFNNVGLDILQVKKGSVVGEFEASEYFRIISQKNSIS